MNFGEDEYYGNKNTFNKKNNRHGKTKKQQVRRQGCLC